MIAIGERAMFSLRLAAFLTLCVSLSSSQINTCSQDLSNVQCRARCAAAASTNSFQFTDCIQHCCGNGGQGAMLPEDCPLQGLNCSQTPNPVNVSSVVWKRNGLKFHYNTSALEVGRDACNMVQDGTIPDGLLPLVVSAGTENGSNHFWILFPGRSNNLLLPDLDCRSNNLLLPDLGSCSNLSMAAVNECGIQELSATDVLPPNVSLKVISLTAIEDENSLPVVTVAWHLEEVEYITDIMYNVTLVESSFLHKNGCVTARKELSQTDLMAGSINFYPEDFQGNSVWLCIYDATVSVSYKAKCGTSTGHGSSALKEQSVLIPEVPRLNTSFSFYWNQSTLSYVIHINWTVPLIYDIPNLVQTFQLTGSTVLHGRPFPSFRNFMLHIPATGDTSYHVTIEDYPPSQDDVYFFLFPRYGFISHPPPLSTELIGPLKLPGEPPSVVVVTSITEVMQGGVRVMWMAPNVTNGAILSYTVEVKLLTEGRHTVYANNYTVTEGLSFIYNFSGVHRTIVDRVQLRVAAQNNFTMGPFSEYAYLDNIRKEVTETAPGSLGTSGGVLAALVIVPVVVTVAGILVVLLIFGVLLYKRRSKPSP